MYSDWDTENSLLFTPASTPAFQEPMTMTNIRSGLDAGFSRFWNGVVLGERGRTWLIYPLRLDTDWYFCC